MPQCVDFDYFGVDWEKQSMLKVTSPGGRRVSWDPQKKAEKARGPHAKRVTGPQKDTLTTGRKYYLGVG